MKEKGSIITLVLVFGGVFLLLLSALLGFILLQLRQARQKVAWNQALHAAEAGLNYYRWCLNNGVEEGCALEKDYFDIEGNLIGRFALTAVQELTCGEITKRTITSSSTPVKFPETQRQVRAIYARPSLAKYAYLINDNVWAGADREIRGLYHTNGGVRMDGENQSLVSSAQDEWVCTESFGCSPCPTSSGCHQQGINCLCPGVFTTTDNSNPDLFDWPVVPFDFAGITIDLAQMKAISQTIPGGLYLPPSTALDPEAGGYHLRFENDGTFKVWLITELAPSWAYSLEEGWHYDYFVIDQEYLFNTYNLDPDCSLVFIEDNLWAEGEVKGKVTVASANLISPTEDTDVVLPGNINYTALDGSDGLALIGERNVLVSPDSPNIMELRGIFMAQKGRFGRNLYWGNIREKLEVSGSIVSNGREGTKWTSGSVVVSGYQERENYFDANLIYSPPPFVPYASADYEILAWEEVE